MTSERQGKVSSLQELYKCALMVVGELRSNATLTVEERDSVWMQQHL